MTTVVQVLVVGILLGLVYTLAGLGMSLSLGVLRVLNLTHGLAVVAGSIFAFELHQRANITPLVSVVLSLPVFFVVGVAMHVLLVQRAQQASAESALLVLFGTLLFMQAVALQVWTGDTRSLSVSYTDKSVTIGSVLVRDDYAVAAAGSIVMLVLIWGYLKYTMTGRAIQALAQRPDAARTLGIDVARYSTLVFGMSLAVAGAAGALLADVFPFSIQTQTQWLAYAFIVVLIGGAGGVLNAAVGGLALGVGQAVFNQLLTGTWVPVVVYGLLVAAMIVRGGGLASKRERAL